MRKGVRARAQVWLGGQEVGTITFRSGGSEFRYTDDLLAADHQVLGQVFEESPRRPRRAAVGVPAWFANLLPEDGSALRRFYATSRLGATWIDEPRLLLGLGNDLPGAVVVRATDIVDDAVLPEQTTARLDPRGAHLSALSGAQLKMSVMRDGDRLTLPAPGETGGWIVKFPDTVYRGLAENEHLMMSWSRVAGLDVPHTGPWSGPATSRTCSSGTCSRTRRSTSSSGSIGGRADHAYTSRTWRRWPTFRPPSATATPRTTALAVR